MATGGYCIVMPNEGNKEYLKDGENYSLYKLGNPYNGVKAIKRLIKNKDLQDKLYKNGLDTAKQRDWKNFKSQIISFMISNLLFKVKEFILYIFYIFR